MNKTIAIKADRELLNRLRIDLIAAGFTDDLEWNNLQQVAGMVRYLSVFEDNTIVLFATIWHSDKTIHMNHANYTEVLNKLKARL